MAKALKLKGRCLRRRRMELFERILAVLTVGNVGLHPMVFFMCRRAPTMLRFTSNSLARKRVLLRQCSWLFTASTGSIVCLVMRKSPKCRKEPITAEMLLSLAVKFQDKCCVCDLRTLALCLVGFAGFFRFSELCCIRCCDIQFFATYCCIFLESSKTDQLREGAWVTIARTQKVTCPVCALEKYMSAAGLDLEDDLPVFRALSPPKCASRVRRQGISYTRARELVKEAFRGITDVSKISLHSLRAGGASAAANAGIPDRLFKRHGRWASENAKDGYVKDDLKSLLSVSRSLGI